jgi:hypothetical protein
VLLAMLMHAIGEQSAFFLLSQLGFIVALLGIVLGLGGFVLRVTFVPILFSPSRFRCPISSTRSCRGGYS